MIKSFDGKSFKRTANPKGEKSPVVGIKKDRAVYTATGGETELNLNSVSPAIQYHPGKNLISVKRSTVSVMMSGDQFYETSPTSISFSTPLEAGEKVEIIKEVAVTGVMAVNSKPDIYTATATEGQTLVKADFFWPYNQNSTKSRGAVTVQIDGVTKERGVHYNEVANGSNSMTSQVSFTSPLSAGQYISLLPTNQVVDQSLPESQSFSADIIDLKNRVETIEATPAPVVWARINNKQNNATNIPDFSTSSTEYVDVPNGFIDIVVPAGGYGIEVDALVKCRYSDQNSPSDIHIMMQIWNQDLNWLWSSREIFSGALLPNGNFTNINGVIAVTPLVNNGGVIEPMPGNYRCKIIWKIWGTNNEVIIMNPWFRMCAKLIRG